MENDLGDLYLFFLEYQIRDRLIIWEFNQKRLDEGQGLINHFFISQVDVSLDDGFGDVLGYFSFSLEFQVFNKFRVLVHGQNDVSHGFKGSGQELSDIHLAVFVDASLVVSTVVRGIAQNVIDILMLFRVAFQSELQKGSIQIKGASDLTCLRVFDKLLDVS